MAKLNLLLKALSSLEIVMLEKFMSNEYDRATENGIPIPDEFMELKETLKRAVTYSRLNEQSLHK